MEEKIFPADLSEVRGRTYRDDNMYYHTRSLQSLYRYENNRLEDLEVACESKQNGKSMHFNDDDMIQDLEQELLRITGGQGDRKQRRQATLLEAMVAELFNAQIQILEQHCINNTRLCVHGQKGARGRPGSKGEVGIKGDTGIQGLKGVAGNPGPKGDPGIIGFKGFQGSKGDEGVKGPPGDKGSKGEPGDPGLAGQKGDPGPPGIDGTKGSKGQKGQRGEKGDTGLVGLKGARGPQGPQGFQGEKGDTGPPGNDGKLINSDCLCKAPAPPSDSRSVKVGQTLQLTCPAQAAQNMNVTWYKIGSTQITERAVQTGSAFSLPQVYPGDGGIYKCIVQQPNGQMVEKTIELKVYGSTKYDCDFESGMCSWLQGIIDDMDWARNKGSTTTYDTGPDSDHTYGNANGSYAYIEASNFSPGSKAHLISPTFLTNHRYCFTFWYNMYGQDTGALGINIQNGVVLRPIWRKKLDQGQGWHRGIVDIPTSLTSFKVNIQASVGNGITSDIALDDILVFDGSCSQNNLVPV